MVKPEVRRGRGRPKKIVNDEAIQPSAPQTTIKKGRGRPKKEESAKVTKPLHSKRGRPKKDATAAIKNAPEVLDALTSTPKPRGRPKKVDASTAVNGTDSDAPTLKRGRGRPRKSDVDTPEAAPQSSAMSAEPKKGRGRPKKVDASTVTNGTHTDEATPKRGRGRPKKDTSDIANGHSEPVTPATAKSAKGRPRKSDIASAIKTSEATSVTKRGRGRPKKSETTEESNASTSKPKPARTKRVDESLRVPNIVGSGIYEMTCKETDADWPVKDKALQMSLLRIDGPDGYGTDYRADFDLGLAHISMKITNAKDIVWQGRGKEPEAYVSGTGTMKILPQGIVSIELVGLYTDPVRFISGQRLSNIPNTRDRTYYEEMWERREWSHWCVDRSARSTSSDSRRNHSCIVEGNVEWPYGPCYRVVNDGTLPTGAARTLVTSERGTLLDVVEFADGTVTVTEPASGPGLGLGFDSEVASDSE